MWNKFEPSSNDDETLGSSFFTAGLFKISNEEKSVKNPRINATLQNENILIAVDHSMIFLDDKTSFDCKFLSFSSAIDCFAVSRNSCLMVCCLSDGNIHGVHIKGIPVFNLMIDEIDISEAGTFVGITQVNSEFIIMCSNGKIYRLTDIDEAQLSQIADIPEIEEEYMLTESFVNSTKIEKISNTKVSNTIHAFCCIQTFDGDMHIACGSENIYFIHGKRVDRIKYPAGVAPIKKILNLENYVLCLTDSGQFVELCPLTKTLQVVQRNPAGQEVFEDMRVIESNDEYIELLVLSKPKQDERSMKVLEFPSMNCKTELSLPAVSWLVSQQKSSVNMYFISGIENENNFVQTIEIKSIIETDPDERYKKLLLRGHFEEAEEHAKQYELSLELLHQARVKKCILDLQGFKPTSQSFEAAFKDLMNRLPAVEDKSFLVTLRMNEISDRSSMTNFLEYLLNNIETNLYQNETNEINELLLRLETLRLIDPDECNMQWQKFLYHNDMARVAMDHFKTDVLLSSLIWSRHSSSIMPKLQMDQFHKWLSSIPASVEPYQLIQWLRHFAPCFLQLYPNQMSFVVEWSLERTRSLQFSNAWPEIGLEFINKINEIFKDVKFMFVDIRRSYHNNMQKIQQLIFTLEEMSVLKATYHLTMTLDDYSKQSIEETAFRLLQRIQMNNLKKMVNDFLYPVFMERGGSPEETIVKYIQFLCTNKNLGYWQERAVASIDLLHNEENRLNSALLVLKVSPVPWGDVVLPLAKLGTTSSHPLANSIFIEYKTQAIKIIKVKYQWPVDYFDLQQDRIKLVFRIIKANNPEMVKDVKTLIESSPEITREAYFYLMHALIEQGKIEEFIELVAGIGDELDTSTGLFEMVTDTFVQKIDDEDNLKADEIENYLEAVKLLVNQLKASTDDFKIRKQEERIKTLKNIIKLRCQLKFNLKLQSINSPVEKSRMLEEGIALVASNINESSSIDGMWSKMDLLVNTFGSNRIHAYFLLCKKLNNLYLTCCIIENLTSSIDFVEKSEINGAVELVTLAIAQQIEFFENNLKPTFDNYDPLAFPLSYELLIKCLVHYDIRYHESVIELMKWLRIGRSFYQFDIIEATKKERVIVDAIFKSNTSNGKRFSIGDRRDSFSMFSSVSEKVKVTQNQTDENLSPVLQSVCNSLKVMIYTTGSNKAPFKAFLQHLPDQVDIAQIKKEFTESLQNILNMKLIEPVLKIMDLVIIQQQAAKALIIPPLFVTSVNNKILKFILSQKEPDYMCAFRILRSESKPLETIDYLRSVLKNNSQKIAFSTFSEMYNNYLGNVGSVADERQNRLKFYYCSELSKYDPSIRYKTNFDSLNINDLLKDLENRQLSVELVKKLSKDFGWDYQRALVQQIKFLLRHQELDFEIKTDVFGKEEVVIKSTVEMILKKCTPYLSEITNLPMLASEMQNYIKEINFYFYEMYLVVLELIERSKNALSIDQKIYRNVLLLLKHNFSCKRRRTEQKDIDAWLQLQLDHGVLPGISKYRLPFKPLMEESPEAYLNDDLNVNTFEKCIPLIKLHATYAKANVEERVEVCGFLAVKNSAMELKAQMETKNGGEWNLKPINNAHLQRILNMVSLLKDKSKRMAILYFHVTHSPEGSDQVEAAYECWKFAVAHEDELLTASPKYGEIIEKIKRKYPLLKTQHLLHVYGLTDDKLMQLVESPSNLINALYDHESILEPQKKNINKLCEELAQLLDVDLLSLQHKLLHKWLAFNGSSMSFEENDVNETMYEDFIESPPTTEVNVVSDESVVRSHYILSSWNSQSAMDFLACELGSNHGDTGNKLQLYECFAKLIDSDSSSYIDLINPNDYLLNKSCHYLKELGIHLKPEKFKDADKVDILKKLWVSHHNNSKALEVMSFICLGFNIHLPQIWNGILMQMVSLKMVHHLSILVEILSTKSKLLHLSSLKSAWECVIKEPFMHATKARTYEQEVDLSKAFILLQKCPISTFLDHESFFDDCLRLERPYMAAIFVAFMNEQKRDKFVKSLSSFDKREMKKNIVELEDLGVAPVITKSVINILKL